MALFSFRHSVKTFSTKRTSNERAASRGQTRAHLRYITRRAAAREVLRERMEGDDATAAQRAEKAAKKRGGRVAERFIVALPVEATPEQRVELARAFAETLTQGRAAYLVAIHDMAGNDATNPHFHLVAFDAFEKTGGRGRPRSVLGMARKGAIEKNAATWARIHNEHMAAWGYGPASQISHLSHAARGIGRIPTIHEGPGALKITERGATPATKNEWRRIDAGHTRAAANHLIREINRMTQEMGDDHRADRLGSGDQGYARERGECGDARRPDARSRGRHAPAANLPFVARHRDSEDAGADRQPPFLADRGAAGDAQRARPPLAAATAAPAAPMAPPDALRRSGSRRGVRRLFVELMMLRDTLRARLVRLRSDPSIEPPPPILSLARTRGSERLR